MVVLVTGCDPEATHHPLPVVVEWPEPGVITVAVPLCAGDVLTSTWVKSVDGDAHRETQRREIPESDLVERIAVLEFSAETLTDASFNLEELVINEEYTRGSFDGIDDVRVIGVRTPRGVVTVFMDELVEAGPGPWLVAGGDPPVSTSGQSEQDLLEEWCAHPETGSPG